MLRKREIEKAMKNNEFMFPEELFDNPIVVNETLILKYSTQKYVKGKQSKYKTIKIYLKKYSS